MGRIISLANQKGGVGKTTTTINLGAALAELANRLLLVDFDPQGALSVGLGVNPMFVDLTIYNLLLDRSVDPGAAVMKTATPGVDLLPSNIDLSAAEVVLVSEVAREQALKRALAPLKPLYDYILIDCPPSLGLLTVNALTASDSVIIPLECEYFALRGMALLLETVDKVRDRLNPELELQGIIATMYDGRTLHGREVLERVREAFGAKLFATVVARTIRFAEAPVAGESILSYASDSKGAAAYRALAKEVLGLDHDQASEPAGGGRAVPGHDGGAGGGPGALSSAFTHGESGQDSTEIYRQGNEDPRPQSGQRPDEARGEGDVLLHP
jgi:chromosome partitioning protein